MSLYQSAESNIRKTWVLLFVFLILFIGLGWVLTYVFEEPIILLIAVIFATVSSISSYWFSDKIVLSMAGAKEIQKRDNPELYRTVENLCITTGLPLPKIYILNEEQPNAFATGRNKDHAVIAVTTGLLAKLEKVELEGVIAHELSHINNRDMLLQTMIVVLVGVIAIVSNIFIRGGFRGRKSSKGGALILVIGIVAVILAPIAANLIKLSISRKREFLADASGALITRYPEGLASALEKIDRDPSPMKKKSTSTAHLFISNPFKGKERKSFFVRMYATHPPTEKRVAALRGMRI
jgi:heat shock protein HtpX